MAMEGWEGVQRQGQDLADRFNSLAQGLGSTLQSHLRSNGGSSQQASEHGEAPSRPVLDVPHSEQIHTPPWEWPWNVKPSSKAHSPFNRVQLHGRTRSSESAANGAADNHSGSGGHDNTGFHELVQRVGQAGVGLGASISGFVSQLTKHLPLPSQGEVNDRTISNPNVVSEYKGDYLDWRQLDNGGISSSKGRVATWKCASNGRQRRVHEDNNQVQDLSNEEIFSLFTKRQGLLHRQGTVNVTTTYDSRTQEVESSVTARGDLWRAEISHGGSSTASPLFLLQAGPILFVRDTTLLLPIHLSKQHLLWYGFDRKNGVHSICPAVWSKHRRWLLMSMICLSPPTCSFLDLQFPNGQFTYVAGEGLSSSAFFPAFGGLLQVQSQRPGITKLSFSTKMRWGTRLTPSIQLPEKSISLDVAQPVAWQRSGIMVRPMVQLRVTPTIGGRNAGWRAEVVHSPYEKLSWACGCAWTIEPTAYVSLSLGKSKRSGKDAGNSGVVLVVETPMENLGRASFCIQLNSGVEF